MSHPSSDQHSSFMWPTLAFFGGMLLGFLPALLFVSTYMRIGPLYPRHLFLQHVSFNLCAEDPSGGAAERALMAVVLYIVEWSWGVISLIIASWKKWPTWWIGGLLFALVLDFLICGGIFYYSLISCWTDRP